MVFATRTKWRLLRITRRLPLRTLPLLLGTVLFCISLVILYVEEREKHPHLLSRLSKFSWDHGGLLLARTAVSKKSTPDAKFDSKISETHHRHVPKRSKRKAPARSKDKGHVFRGSPWPLPQSYFVSNEVFEIADEQSFRFIASNVSCDLIDKAFKRYKEIIFDVETPIMPQAPKRNITHPLSRLEVKIGNPCEVYPSLASNESYSLTISQPAPVLNAETVWGAIRGLETFSQLIYENAHGMLVINKTSIEDFPRFKYRGLLLDSARHFITIPTILKFLDAMSYNKFNVFHWHMVDDDSFPFESAAFPSLSQQGAYDDLHVYAREEVLEVVEYARLRGIRVLPEFDTPDHTEAWGAIPNLLTPCYNENGEPTGDYGPINPINNSTYEFLKTFFTEIVDLFPDEFIHIGGDEVIYDCWKSNPDIKAFMEQEGFGENYDKLLEYYQMRLFSIMSQLNAKTMVWQEVIDNNVKASQGTIVQTWKDHKKDVAKMTSLGYPTVQSNNWYLCYTASPYTQDWKDRYLVDPTSFKGTKDQKKLVLGGEACIWGEFVDSSNLIQRTWPRACAVGERLWSAESVKSVSEAAPRLDEQRCRMVRRGLQTEPITGPGYCPFEYVEYD